MRLTAKIGVIVLALAFVTGACTQAPPPAPPNEEPAVRAAVDQFYAALNAMFAGEVDPMIAVWSHADDTTYMGPMDGFQVGWPAIRAVWQAQAAAKLGGKVSPENMRFTIGTDLALTHNYEVGENVGADGVVNKVSIRVTNVFRKEAGVWKMIGHHTDLLPALVPKD
jgi:ketosteroid isomerase-like protein